MKTMQVFDCQDMPGGYGRYNAFPNKYDDDQNLASQFLRLNPYTPNDTTVAWSYHSMSDEELEEYFYAEPEVWRWRHTPLEAAKKINQWLRDNGATDPEVLVQHWW